MTRAQNIIKKILRISISVLIIIFIAMHAVAYRQNNQQYENTFQQYAELHDVPYTIDTIRIGDHAIAIAVIGNKTQKQLLLIHGAPGNMLSYRSYLQSGRLLSEYQIILVDRPGYGSSSHQPVLSIKDQGDLIRQAIKKYHTDPLTVVGHSYGGPIALYLAVQYPTKIQDALLLAAPLDPAHEKIRGISYMIDTTSTDSDRPSATRWLFPRLLKVTNDEKLSHAQALEAIIPLYKKLRVPVTAWFGDIDWLVPPHENKYFLETQIPPQLLATRMREGWSHVDRLTNPETVEDFLLKR